MKKENKNKINFPPGHEVVDFLFESNAIEGVHGGDAFIDAKKAWDYAMKKDTITEKEVRHIHKLLMKNVGPAIAGKFRDCDVYIGNEHKRFINEGLLTYQVNSALTAIWMSFGIIGKEGTDETKEEIAKDCHVMFEGVHPFVDGNGRVGRILYNWHRLQLGLPIHIIHEGKEQMEYYKWFQK